MTDKQRDKLIKAVSEKVNLFFPKFIEGTCQPDFLLSVDTFNMHVLKLKGEIIGCIYAEEEDRTMKVNNCKITEISIRKAFYIPIGIKYYNYSCFLKDSFLMKGKQWGVEYETFNVLISGRSIREIREHIKEFEEEYKTKEIEFQKQVIAKKVDLEALINIKEIG